MNIGQLDGQPLVLQIFNGMTAESTCVNERWAKGQLFRCVCFAGGRHQTILDETVGQIFQSPSSVWRTTTHGTSSAHTTSYFNPRPPCGGRQGELRPCRRAIISIHVLRVEDDRRLSTSGSSSSIFQSTSSVWRTTSLRIRYTIYGGISIHVLRVEDDWPDHDAEGGRGDFNPRPPCGGRPRHVFRAE